MDLKNSQKMIRRIKRIFSVSLVMLCSLLLILEISPVKVYAANYTAADFVKKIVVDGNMKKVYYEFGSPIQPYSIFFDQNSTQVGEGYGSTSHQFAGGTGGYRVSITTYHFGSKFYTNGSARDGLIDISDISDGAEIVINAGFSVEWLASVNPQGFPTVQYRNIICCYDANFQMIDSYIPAYSILAKDTKETQFGIQTTELYTVPDGGVYIASMTQMQIYSTANIGTITFSVRPDPIQLSVDLNMIYEQSQTMQKIEQQLGSIGGKLDDTNDKLDDIITGGEAGEELGAAGDRLDDASNDAADSMGSVDDFENSMMQDAQDKLDDLDQMQIVTGVGDFSDSLQFVSGYVTDIFEGVEEWSVVITAPLFLGLVMYICSHSGGLTHVVQSARADAARAEADASAAALAARRESEMKSHISRGSPAETYYVYQETMW